MAVDPNTDITHLPGTIIRDSVPKALSLTQFEVSVQYRSADCRVILETSNPEEMCSPCSIASYSLKRAERKKTKASSTPAKSKASLAACGQEKLRATV